MLEIWMCVFFSTFSSICWYWITAQTNRICVCFQMMSGYDSRKAILAMQALRLKGAIITTSSNSNYV